MRSTRKQVLVGFASVVIVAGLTCGLAADEKKSDDKKSKERQEIKFTVVADAASAEGTSYRVWTVTIVPGTKTATECVTDNPAQEMYTNNTVNDGSLNDQIMFKSNNLAYKITFPNDATPLSKVSDGTAVGTALNPINVPANGSTGPFVISAGLKPEQDAPTGCKTSGKTCVFPYNINFVAGGGGQCSATSGPNKGSNDIIVKCGPSC